MRKHTKRLLAFLLTLVMVVSLVNVKQFSVTAEAPEAKTEVSRTETFTKTDTAVKSGDVKKEESKKDSSADEDEKQDKQENGESDTAALKDQADADDTDDVSGQKDQTAVQKENAENDAGTTDKQDADSKGDSKTEETEGKETAEKDKKSDSVSNQTDSSSEKDKSGQTAVTGQTNSGKTESSAAQKKENTDTPTDNQKDDEKNNAVTDEKSDTVKDETDADDTLTYVQTARKALAKMGAAEAFAEGNTIPNAREYFTLAGNGEAQPESFVVKTGDISAETVPSITGYDFVNATINDIEVESVGTLTYEGKDYIYYTTEGSSTGLAAMVLEENEKITLNYELHRETYQINYEITGGNQGDDVSKDDIFGTDRPTEVKENGSYAFRVTIPRGYEAVIAVNGAEQGKLGIEPDYVVDNPVAGQGSVISADTSNGKSGELILSGTYEIKNVHDIQNVEVTLTRRTSYTFSAALWTKTRYANGRADFGNVTSSYQATRLEGNSKQQIWSFTTNTNGAIWILDSLQINGTKLNIPYANSLRWGQTKTETTTLPSGTVVTLSLTRIQNNKRTYTLSVSNCFEDITVTGGNLNSSEWNEIIADRLTGVVFQILDHQLKDNPTYNQWKSLEQSEPFSVGSINSNDKNYWFPNQYNSKIKDGMRFRLLPGYVNPKVTYGTPDSIDNNGLQNLITNLDTEPVYDQVTGEYWYYFDVTGQGGSSQTMLRIEAEVGQYSVTYEEGDLAVAGGTVTNLPSDSNTYNIIDENQIIVSSTIPVDTTGNNTFAYWTLDGYKDNNNQLIHISPNQLLNLEYVADYAVEGTNGKYILPLKAHWVDSTKAEQISYTIQLILRDGTPDGNIVDTIYSNAPVGSTVIIQKDAPEIQKVLEDHPDYAWDDTNKVYYSDVQATTVINLYFVKNTTTVTIEKQVTGNMGDKNQKFNFDWMLDDVEQDDFQLADDGKKEITATIGDAITFGETNAEGYTVTVAYTDAEHTEPQILTGDDSDGYYTATVTKDMHIIVTNDKQVHAPTGLSGGSDSWMILLGAAAVFAVTSGLYGLRRKKAGAHD